MSQSEKDIDRQVRRHKGPLIGFVVIGLFVGALLIWWLGSEFSDADSPQGAPVQIDGRTGEPVD
jgi:hypothetical protein